MLCAGFAFASPSTVDEALSAYRKSHLADARAGFAYVAADSEARPRDRAVARRELARVAWLIDGDAPAALAQLASAVAWEDEPCETAALLVRVLRESGQPTKAVDAAAARRSQCTDKRDALLIQEARAWADLAIQRNGSLRFQALAKMKTALEALTNEGRRRLDGARLDLELGLLSATPDRAFEGWRTFFWLSTEEAPPALLKDFPNSRELFQRALARSAKLKDEIELLRLLVRAGFCQEAQRFAAVRSVAARAKKERTRKWPSIDAYFRFHEAVKRMTLAHYRDIARGKDDNEAYQTNINKLLDHAATEFPSRGEETPASTRDVLRQAWGIYFTIGPTGGFMSLHLGHIIEDVREEIAQHGRSGAVERIVLENMLSNAYEGWLWDGYAQAGGWAEAGARVIQVRTSYVGSVLTALGLRPGRPARAKVEAELPELVKRDEETLQTRPLGDLHGLAQRLQLQAIDQIVADVRSHGEDPDDDNAFQGRYWRAILWATITVHEGRHILDQMQYPGDRALSSEELEFRAKLSELQFDEYPRLSLRRMVTGQIGGESSHAKANTRILKELGLWIEKNSTAVEGFNPDRPVWSQIDKLTDKQLRSFACSRDPACQHQ
jgi:hypothetical protein